MYEKSICGIIPPSFEVPVVSPVLSSSFVESLASEVSSAIVSFWSFVILPSVILFAFLFSSDEEESPAVLLKTA